MAVVSLIPLTDEEREAFLEEKIADHADQQVRDAGWPRTEAAERARAEVGSVWSVSMQTAKGEAIDCGLQLTRTELPSVGSG